MFLLNVQLVDHNNIHVFPSGRTGLSVNSIETSNCTLLRVKKTSLFVELSTYSVGAAIVCRVPLFSHLFFIICQQKLSVHPNL